MMDQHIATALTPQNCTDKLENKRINVLTLACLNLRTQRVTQQLILTHSSAHCSIRIFWRSLHVIVSPLNQMYMYLIHAGCWTSATQLGQSSNDLLITVKTIKPLLMKNKLASSVGLLSEQQGKRIGLLNPIESSVFQTEN